MLVQQLIVGLRNEKARENLLSEKKDLSWEKVCDIASHQERVRQNLQQLNQANDAVIASLESEMAVSLVNTAVSSPRQRPSAPSKQLPSCYRCGQHHIRWSDCRHQKTLCQFCKKIGHIERMCFSKRRANTNTYATYPNPAEDGETILRMFSDNALLQSPYTITLPVDHHPVKFEIDTGSAVTLINEASLQKLPSLLPASSTFRSYTGQNVEVRGVFTAEVEHDGELHYLPVHVVRGSQQPNLLGRNWIKCVPSVLSYIHRIGANPALDSILVNHKDLFRDDSATHYRGPPVKSQFQSDFRPRFFKARTVPYAVAPKVAEELDRLQKADIIEPMQYSEWAAPIVPVLKFNGSGRICGDYKKTINSATKLNPYPLPRIEDLYASLAGGHQFTTLDLKHAYNQVVLDTESRDPTTINTHRGLFRYRRLPSGVSSALGLFQCLIDNLVKDIPHVCAYLDDILVTGPSEHSHLETLKIVLGRLEDAGFKLRKDKCTFLADSVEYLGFMVDKTGLHPLEHKFKALKTAPRPNYTSQLRSFLGLVTHSSRFTNQSATILKPLYRLLEKSRCSNWSGVEQSAFELAKAALTSSSVLVHYDPEKPIILKCKPSPYDVGAVLMHRMPSGVEMPIAFASRTMSQAETKYSQLDKEALAIMFGLHHFHLYPFGRPFEIHTDNKPLLGLLGGKRGIQQMSSPRMQRWALTVSAYTYAMKYVTGSANVVADALSRLPIVDDGINGAPVFETVNLLQNPVNAPVTCQQIRQWTSRDPLLSRVKRALQSGWPSSTSSDFQPFFSRQNELSLQDGCILWGNRVVVPPQGRRAILRDLHNAHPGTVRIKPLTRSYVWWPKINADIENVVKACHVCQITRKTSPKVPLKPWAWPDSPWKRVHVDYFGPFQGHMVLVVVDAHTKWIDAIPTGNSCSSLTTINKLRTVFSTFGIPEMVVSDNGPAFTSAEFKDFMEKNGIRHLTTAPYHAASNGLAERAVQTIKHGLAKQTEADLATKLSRFLFSYRITPNDSTGTSPAELMFKRQLRTRLDLLNPSTHDRVIAKQTKMKARYDANTRPRVVAPNESVYTRLEHETNWCPAVVRTSEGQIVELELKDGRIVRRHLDQVRSRTDTVSGEFGKFEPATLDRDPDIPRTEHLLPAQSITTPAEAYVPPPPPFTPASTSLGTEDPVTAQSGAEVENTALRRSTRIRKLVQRFQDESY
ncbi:hypothetical protein SprV_0902667900 [Sparganum proliferum]